MLSPSTGLLNITSPPVAPGNSVVVDMTMTSPIIENMSIDISMFIEMLSSF